MSETKTPDMWDDCNSLVRLTENVRKMTADQNALLRRIKAMNVEAEDARRRIKDRMIAAGLESEAVVVGDHVITLGSRGFVHVGKALSPFNSGFRDAEPMPVIAADAATDAPLGDEDEDEDADRALRAAAKAFRVDADLDDPISEAAFRMAMEAEGGDDLMRALSVAEAR